MFLLGYFRDADMCKWRKVAVMVWVGDGNNLGEVAMQDCLEKHKNKRTEESHLNTDVSLS